MNLSFFIAKKYFLSRKKRSFINFISIISMLGVAVGLSSLIIILSVFNGLEDLNRQIFKAFDPDLKIYSKTSKTFVLDNKLVQAVNSIEGVDFATQVYHDKALARGERSQTIVDVKGVDSTFSKNLEFKESNIGGIYSIYNGNRPAAYIGAEVYNSLQLTVNDIFSPVSILYPKNQKLNVLNPEDNINRVSMEVSGVFMLEQQYDNFIYIPLEVMEQLTGNENKRTAIEVTLKPGANITRIKNQIKDLLGDDMIVKDRDEQNESLLRAIKIEKLFIFIALVFVVGIAAFNIFYALSMLVLDKKDDISTLSSLGADESLIKKIFLTEGFIIGGVGIIVGLFTGLIVCWVQIQFGIIGLGMAHAITDAYPVRIMFLDVLFSVIAIAVITFLASIIPAKKAASFILNRKDL